MGKHGIPDEIEEGLHLIAEDTVDFDAWLDLGDAYVKYGYDEDAIQAYLMVMSLTPRWWKAYQRLGEVYERLERFDDAIALYREAIAFDVDFLIPLGALYQRLGRYEEASEMFCKEIAECASPEDTLKILLGGANAGKFGAALKTLSFIQNNRVGWTHVEYALGYAYEGLGRNEESKAAFERFLRSQPYLDSIPGRDQG